MPAPRLDLNQAVLLVVDVQERLCAAMEREALDRTLARVNAAIEGAKALGLPVVVTEQYPKGLGPTHSLVKLRLGAFQPVEKLFFSAATPEVLALLEGKKQVLLLGMESHVCVFQTARDLVERGFQVQLLADAVLSRTEEDRRVGLALCQEAGARVMTVEAALFDLLATAENPAFKKVSAAVK